jgi:hypothetical protein
LTATELQYIASHRPDIFLYKAPNGRSDVGLQALREVFVDKLQMDVLFLKTLLVKCPSIVSLNKD